MSGDLLFTLSLDDEYTKDSSPRYYVGSRPPNNCGLSDSVIQSEHSNVTIRISTVVDIAEFSGRHPVGATT